MENVTKDQIEAWKEKYQNVSRITLDTEEKKKFYVRSPKIKEIEAIQPLLQQGKYITANITLFKTCYLGGDEIPTEEKELIGAATQMMDTIETVTSGLEKL